MSLNTFFRVLFTPMCWLRNHSVDHEHSRKLDYLLDTEAIILPEHRQTKGAGKGYPYHIKLGDITIWTANYPYSFGNEYSFDSKVRGLPTRAVCFRLHDTLKTVLECEKLIKSGTIKMENIK